MRISVGLDQQDNGDRIREFAASGAGEFFAGFVPREWFDRFGWEIGLNRRTFGAQSQYTRIEELAEAIETSHACNCPISITFNEHDYGVERLAQVREILQNVDRLGPDTYIVADPALMVAMEEWGIERPLILSTGAGCFNSAAVRFYCSRFNVHRVVIPRKMTLLEMKSLIDGTSGLDLEFEAMVIGYRCHFNDEFCFSLHSGISNNLCTDFVSGHAETSKRFPDNWKETLEAAIAAPEAQFDEGSALDVFRAGIRTGLPEEPAAPKAEEKGLDSHVAFTFFNNCGLCHIRSLLDIGVEVLKVPVRGAPWQKRRYLQAVKMIAVHPSPTREVCRELVGSAGFCDSLQGCYYDFAGQIP